MNNIRPSGDDVSGRLSRTLELFGIEKLRPEQHDLIEPSIAGKDVFGILPTGFGKSFCFQAPGIVLGVTTLVVSPLIALQEDQVQSLRKRGIHAFALHSGIDELKRKAIQFYFRRPRVGIPSFLYASPETLLGNEFRVLLDGVAFHRIAIDEAHCVSTWGNAFRPDYQRLEEVVRRLGIPHRSAFTATVDGRIERDILKWIPLRPGYVRVEADPYRPNLELKVQRAVQGVTVRTKGGQKKLHRLHELLTLPGYEGPAIVYCRTKGWSAQLYEYIRRAQWLRERGYSPYLFHADLPYDDKQMALSGFTNDPKPIVFATSAFGLGVDRADIRQIVHYSTPYTLIDYVQQIGRGGRDGLPTLCTAFHSPDDYLERQIARVARETPTIDAVERVLKSMRKAIAERAPRARATYTVNAFLARAAAMTDANDGIKRKALHMQRVTTSVGMLQRIGLVRAGERGLEAHALIPGTPPHRQLLDITRMDERMAVREQERMTEFFSAERPDQALLWKLIRAE